jgi:hypothetical protein
MTKISVDCIHHSHNYKGQGEPGTNEVYLNGQIMVSNV